MSDLTLFTETRPARRRADGNGWGDRARRARRGHHQRGVARLARDPPLLHRSPRHLRTVPPAAGAQDPTKCTALRTGRRFVRDGRLTMELQVSSGTLDLGGRPMMEGMLHHAAHGLALTRGVSDTSSAGRWHN
ncbi:hypothetical protein [Streptomyces bacillaris]